MLRSVVALLLSLAGLAAGGVPPRNFDAPSPSSISICVVIFPPFILPSAWRSLAWYDLYSALPGFAGPLTGQVYTGANATAIDGFDAAFARLVLKQILDIEIVWIPFADPSSAYSGLLNGDCDMLASGAELDPDRVACPSTCPSSLPELPSSDYSATTTTVRNSYVERYAQTCCFEYSVPYLNTRGFALMSLGISSPNSPLAAVFSVQVLNTATPIVVAIVGFGSVIWLLERRRSPNWTPVSAVYFAFISTSTFGYGDFSPASPIGRLLTSFWAIFTVLALTALTGVVSSELTVASLQYTTITDLGQVEPAQLCIPHYYRTLHLFVSEAMNLPLTNNEFVGGGVVLSDEFSCLQMVLNGTVKAFMTDSSVLAFMAYGWNQDTNALFISPSVRANPMSWVFPSNSPYTTPLNRAIIESLVNNTWHGQKTALESIWFPAGSPQSTFASEPQVNVPMLTAALVLTGAWLLCLFSQSLWEVTWISRLLRRYLPQRLVGPPPPLAEGKKAVTPFHAPGSQGAALESSREAAAACKAAAASAIEAATKAEQLAQELELSFLRAGSPTSARIETTL